MKNRKSSKTCNKQVKNQLKTERSHLKSKLSKEIFREAPSPRSPPYLNSRLRLRELELEKDIKSRLNLQRHPELVHLNYKGWRSRTNDEHTSYLDTLFAKQLAKQFTESCNSVNTSKASLQSLSKHMESFLNPSKTCRVASRKSTENPKIQAKLKLAEEISLKLFNRVNIRNQQVDEAAAKLDQIRLSVKKNK